MFEKEAEEYTYFVKSTKERCNCHEIFYADVELAYQKGAEFGYNKCFEQIRKLVDEDTRLDCIIPELLRLQEIEND